MPKIALIQLSADARPSVNKEKTESAIREAAANGAQIVCTQELFTTEYFCRTEECDLFDLAEPVPGIDGSPQETGGGTGRGDCCLRL